MGLIDTHTHLESFVRHQQVDAVLGRARTAGVEALITIGTSPEDWLLYRSLATDHSGFVYYSVGLHPCSVGADWEIAVAGIEGFWAAADALAPIPGGMLPARSRPVALGECGLDRFHLPKDALEAERIFLWQKAAFAAQLEIAVRLACPIVIHSRGAFAECVAMIDASGVDWSKVVFHCFTDGVAEMKELQRRGGWGSFTGILTYKSAEAVRAAARAQGLERLMIETDAPYLTPAPHRGKPNEPAFVRHTAEYAAAEVFGVAYEKLVATTSANARQFFSL